MRTEQHRSPSIQWHRDTRHKCSCQSPRRYQTSVPWNGSKQRKPSNGPLTFFFFFPLYGEKLFGIKFFYCQSLYFRGFVTQSTLEMHWEILFLPVSYIIGQALHSVRKTLPIRHQLTIEVSLLFQPAVVDVDVFVARCCVALVDYYVGHCPEESIAGKNFNCLFLISCSNLAISMKKHCADWVIIHFDLYAAVVRKKSPTFEDARKDLLRHTGWWLYIIGYLKCYLLPFAMENC